MAAKFGETVVELGFITREKLEEVLEMQRKGRVKIGQVMVNLGILKHHEVEDIVMRREGNECLKMRFGECAVHLGFVPPERLAEALKYQTTSMGLLGDLLIELGYLSIEQRHDAIRQQAMM